MKKFRWHISLRAALGIGNALLLVCLLGSLYHYYTTGGFRQAPKTGTDTAYGQEELPELPPRKDLADIAHPSYMIYYGELDEEKIAQAKQYDIVILHPRMGNLTRRQVWEIQSGGAYVLGYLSIGEDLRTAGMTPEDMLADIRFRGDGSGPRVDARDPGDRRLYPDGILGIASPGGSGYASYYLDDNDHDGRPDFNPNFGCAYTNIGDPAWYDELMDMAMDGADGIPGICEILTEDHKRGLGCDGLFLDTVDTCAPNSYTTNEDPGRTRFEWTAPGFLDFVKWLKRDFPEKYVLQNRGLFFYNDMLPHFDYVPGRYIDFLLYESYMLDSNPSNLYYENFFSDNKNVYAPKINAEANRPDGFRVLSLGYAEGPEEYQLKDTLLGRSDAGLHILLKDMHEAQDEAGFTHYITDGALMLTNDFVLEHRKEDTEPPVWSSVHNDSFDHAPEPRVGIGQAQPSENGVTVSWDVAIDRSGVSYTLYMQKSPFDFAADPDLKRAQKVELAPDVGEGYGYPGSADTWPYQEEIPGLDAGEEYYFLIRAHDRSAARNEEKNTKVLQAAPLA